MPKIMINRLRGARHEAINVGRILPLSDAFGQSASEDLFASTASPCTPNVPGVAPAGWRLPLG